tara:strand:+ start:490 stop:1266 length:777 start_codon:yes stop_codon:yes gene_type:complete
MKLLDDFTLQAYVYYIKAIKNSYSRILRFDEFFLERPYSDSYCIIRHDVDRFPQNALAMALLENKFGIKSTYYFRATNNVFIPEIIKKISSLGHEIGYHYESLSTSKGDMNLAMTDFKANLSKFKHLSDIKTISMHGNPRSKFDNRLMWANLDSPKKLMSSLGILGEVYLDIDYSNIHYVSDTGRSWTDKSNIRDRVDSAINHDFNNIHDILKHIVFTPEKSMIFSIHPERWPYDNLGFIRSKSLDFISNIVKKVIYN